jgi:hypothetical protein
MTAPERFSAWLSREIAPLLRAGGFTKTSANFHLRGNDGWGVINFQKSAWGSRDKTLFYINVAVALDKLLTFQGLDPAKKPPSYNCNWQMRLEGHQRDGTPVERWSIDHATDLDALTVEIRGLIFGIALPWIGQRLTETGFVEAALVAAPWEPIKPPLDRIRAVLATGEPRRDAIAGRETGQ